MMSRRLAASVFVVAATMACRGADATPSLGEANALAVAGKFTEAAAAFQKIVDTDATNGPAYVGLADALERSGGDLPVIRQARLRAAEILTSDPDVQLQAGWLLAAASRWDAAALRADLVLQRVTKSWSGRLLRAAIAQGRDDLPEARRLVDEAIALAPAAAAPQVSLGRLHQRQRRRDDAEAAFRRALVLEPSDAEAHAALGSLCWNAGRWVEAERLLIRATELDPREPRAFRTLASLYEASGRVVEVEAPLRTWADLRGDRQARLVLVDYYIEANRVAQADAVLQAMPRGADPAEIELRRADVAFRRNDKAGAYRLIAAVLARDPRRVGALVMEARLRLHEGRLDDALVPVRQAVAVDAESADAHLMLGTILAERHEVDAAVEAFTRVTYLTGQAEAREAQDELLSLRLQQGAAGALDQLATAVQREPTRLPPALALTRVLLQRGDLRRADATLAALVHARPKAPAVQTLMGRLRLAQGRFDDARRAFDSALTANPRLHEAFRGRVDTELRTRDVTAARSLVDLRLATVVTVPDLLLAARVYGAGGDAASAERTLRRVLTMQPDSEPAMTALVQLFAEQQRLEAARAAFETSAGADVDPRVAPTMVALILDAQDKHAEATAALEAVLAQAPASPVAMVHLARLYANGGTPRQDAALDLAWRAKLLAPESGEAAATLGWVYYKRGDAARAIPQFETAVAALPANAQFRYRLGLSYALAGDQARAREAIDHAVRIRPAYRQALAAQADLRRGLVPKPSASPDAGAGR